MASFLHGLAPIGLAATLVLGAESAHAQARPVEYESPRGGVVAGGAVLAAIGAAGMVGGAVLLRSTRARRSNARLAIGSGTAILGGILLPLGLSLAASGTQWTPKGDTVPRDSSQMVAGGLVSTVGGIALGGGAILVGREKSGPSPGGLALLGAGNVLIGVGLPLWVRGGQRVPAESTGQQEQPIRSAPVGRPVLLPLRRTAF